MLKSEATQKVELVNITKDASEELASQSSTMTAAQTSGFVKITTLLADRRRRASLMLLGLAVLVGTASFPTANADNTAVAAESVANSLKSGSASDQSVAQLHRHVSAMQARSGQQKPSVLIAQSIPVRYSNQASPSSQPVSSGSAVTIDVASPKTRAFKPATAGQAAFNQGGYESDPKESEDRSPSNSTGTTTIGFSWPAAGKLTSKYGRRWGRMHKGIDIAGPVGTPINAAADGTVISAGWHSGGYGNLVEIKHGDGTTTRYAHNSRISVSVGQTVRQGQLLAAMGSTGNSTGSHLHFEIRHTGGSAVNPIAHLPANS